MAADHGIIPDRADLMHIDMGNGLRTHSESVSGSPHGRGVPEAAAGVIMKWLCSGSPGRSCAELRYVGEAASIASCTYGHGGARTAPGMLREKRDVPERTTEEALEPRVKVSHGQISLRTPDFTRPSGGSFSVVPK